MPTYKGQKVSQKKMRRILAKRQWNANTKSRRRAEKQRKEAERLREQRDAEVARQAILRTAPLAEYPHGKDYIKLRDKYREKEKQHPEALGGKIIPPQPWWAWKAAYRRPRLHDFRANPGYINPLPEKASSLANKFVYKERLVKPAVNWNEWDKRGKAIRKELEEHHEQLGGKKKKKKTRRRKKRRRTRRKKRRKRRRTRK